MSSINSVRIVNVDFYMAAPILDLDMIYSDFRAFSINQVPVVRIFGATNTGKKICLHVHGVFPYLYIPHDGTDDPNVLKYQIAYNIDKALNIYFGQASSTNQHVYKVTLISGIPFYGYHAGEHQFFKIHLYNPNLVRKVSNLLQSESVLGKIYQPHESHIPFILQFMIDYNLHGMSFIKFANIKFRYSKDVPKHLLLPAEVIKTSTCEVEGDILSEQILNRQDIELGAKNPGIEALWLDEKLRKRAQGLDSQIGTCLTLEITDIDPTESHKVFEKALLEKLSLSRVEEEEEGSDGQNLSVYPAETPEDETFQNASFIEFHSPSFGSDTLNDTLDLDATLTGDAKDLFEVLQDLEANAEAADADSILSQVSKPAEEEFDENYFDLSMPLSPQNLFGDEDTNDETLVPQLDGNCDSDSDCENKNVGKSIVKKARSGNRYKPLPICISSTKKKCTDIWIDDNCMNVKRKLSFTPQKSDVTVMEETVECRLRHRPKRIKISKELIELPVQVKESSVPKREPSPDIIESSPLKTTDLILNNHKTPMKPNLADLYDQENQIEARPSTSKKISQSSTPESNDTYYKGDVSVLFYTQQSESSGELLTPFQSQSGSLIQPSIKPPTSSEVLQSMNTLNLPKVKYQSPFYDQDEDVTGSVQVGHSVLKVPSKRTSHVEEFQSTFNAINDLRKTYLEENVKFNIDTMNRLKLAFCPAGCKLITPLLKPPSRSVVKNWIRKQPFQKKCVSKKPKEIYIPNSPGNENSDLEVLSLTDEENESNSGQITGVTMNETYGFQTTVENYQNARAQNDYQYLTVMSMELHIETREDFKPDPAQDPIRSIFYSISEDSPNPRNRSSFICCDVNNLQGSGIPYDDFLCVNSEKEIFDQFLMIFIATDADILIGYEIEMLSWGYFIERAKVLGINILPQLSRVNERIVRNVDDDQSLKLTGRIILDGWRMLRHEVALQSYTFESMYYQILHRRVPMYSFKDLTSWWDNPSLDYKHLVVDYYKIRIEGILKILEQLDLIGRTSELARIFGIQFYEVLSRGTQFRVESMMLRLAKPLNYIAVSPSTQQRAQMKAPEFLPLILEPESKFYTDPVIVLDFQSLYPSVMIAYNYCFSTCLGKVHRLGKNTPFEFGTTQLKVSKKRIEHLLSKNALNFSPCGVAFVKSSIRDGVLPRMLREILEARLMVKQSMKQNKDDKVLKKVLHNRQLGLKLIANVTYGYTSANFSGRMPAVELGDSVVSKGRETLQRAIKMVETTPEWGARVVYGDTDSLFVLVKGQSKEGAFDIGRQIADAVTAANPDPIKLKLEKVYLPCVLQTKKRYVGYMYESPEQIDPIYNAKGIETVRRDGCPVVAKMLEKCLRVLFETKNVSHVKQYVLRQFNKLLLGRVNLQDLTFAKEYRGMAGYRPGACVPALELARKWMLVDKRSEPRRSERVPYIIANGPPGLPLIKLVKSPRQFLNDSSLRPNITYYITKVIIPPLNRCFNLIGVDVASWYNQMPRKVHHYFNSTSPGKKSTISQYFSMSNCAVCDAQSTKGLCDQCRDDKQKTFADLLEKIRTWEHAHCQVLLICQSCSGIKSTGKCTSLDCPVLYKLNQTNRDLQQSDYMKQLL